MRSNVLKNLIFTSLEMDGINDYHQVYGDMLDIEVADPVPDLISMYDHAIREGDLAYVTLFLDLYHHVEVSILLLPPIEMLESANHDVLLFLDEKEYIVLPDIVRAIVYDDPIPLGKRPIDAELSYIIFKYDAYDIFNSLKAPILDVICMSDDSQCDQLLMVIHGRIARDLFKDSTYARRYLDAISHSDSVDIDTLALIILNNRNMRGLVMEVARTYNVATIVEEIVTLANRDPEFRMRLNQYD